MLGSLVQKPAAEIVKLDGNENPYGCSPRVRESLKSYPYYNIYPDPAQREFRKAVAKYIGVGQGHIVGGSGSDDLIELIVRLFVGPGDKVINLVPTFGMYSFLTGLYQGKTVDMPRRPDFGIDISAVKAAIDESTKIVFIASPNNPSGNMTSWEDIAELLKRRVVVVLDEAYAEFSGVSVASMVTQYENLVVLRTFSKWAGLAGLRAGYGIFPEKLARYTMKIKQPYNINCAAQAAVLASLEDIGYLQQTVVSIVHERQRLMSKLAELPFLKPFPSSANFILCRVTRGNARDIKKGLETKGIFVRYFDTPLLRNYLRITVGKPEHTDLVIRELRTMGESL